MGGTFAGYGKLEDSYHKQDIKLGEGSFGTVWRGVRKSDNAYVAIKQLSMRGSGAGRNRAAYEKEVKLLSSVKHENVVNLHGVFENQDDFSVVLDYCDGGDLGDRIKQPDALKIQQVKDYTCQMFMALNALHSVDIIHRDVKPDNFLIAAGKNGKQVLKLTDFGIAEVLPKGQVLHSKCGTPAFMSPEQHQLPEGNGYDFTADLWAAGIIVFMLQNKGKHPFMMKNGYLDIATLMKGKSAAQGIACLKISMSRDGEDGKKLYTTLLSKTPSDRHSYIEHPWARNVGQLARPSQSRATCQNRKGVVNV
jgi:serine/threonine protein kinase